MSRPIHVGIDSKYDTKFSFMKARQSCQLLPVTNVS